MDKTKDDTSVEKRGIFHVVRAAELEKYTSAGWVVRETHIEDEIVGLDEPISLEEQNLARELQQRSGYVYNGGMAGGTDSQGRMIPHGHKRRHALAKSLRFVIVLDEESKLHALDEELARHRNTITELKEKEYAQKKIVEAAEKSTRQNEKALTQHADDLKAARAALEQEKALRFREREAHTKLERDMHKVRDMIGALKWKEIVG